MKKKQSNINLDSIEMVFEYINNYLSMEHWNKRIKYMYKENKMLQYWRRQKKIKY